VAASGWRPGRRGCRSRFGTFCTLLAVESGGGGGLVSGDDAEDGRYGAVRAWAGIEGREGASGIAGMYGAAWSFGTVSRKYVWLRRLRGVMRCRGL
jgi:hypothetical protein